jgi:hypothetical protein
MLSLLLPSMLFYSTGRVPGHRGSRPSHFFCVPLLRYLPPSAISSLKNFHKSQKHLPKRIFFLKHAPRSVHDVAVHDVGDVRGPVRYRPYRVRAGAVGVGADGLRQYAEPR